MKPENEQGVIVLFAQQATAAGFEIISIHPTFPDAVVRRANTEYRTEFEYRASGFIDHKHDPRGCDLIICWQNDLPDYFLPILALSSNDWISMDLILPSAEVREIAYWKARAGWAENELERIGREFRDFRRAATRPPELAIQLKRLGKAALVYHCLEQNPERSISSLAKEFQVSPQAISQHVARLVAAGLVERDGQGFKLLASNGNGR